MWWSEVDTRWEAAVGIPMRTDNNQERREAMEMDGNVELMAAWMWG